MKRTYLKVLILVGVLLSCISCNKIDKTPAQLERDEIMAVEDLLRDNLWALRELSVSVKYETMAVPLLANVADENGRLPSDRCSGGGRTTVRRVPVGRGVRLAAVPQSWVCLSRRCAVHTPRGDPPKGMVDPTREVPGLLHDPEPVSAKTTAEIHLR